MGINEESGYIGEQISFKSDQEPSIVALKNAVSAARIGETVPIESLVCASKSNGMMEHAVKIWQGQLKPVKHFGESRIGKCIEPGSALFTCLHRFALTSSTSSVLEVMGEWHTKGLLLVVVKSLNLICRDR